MLFSPPLGSPLLSVELFRALGAACGAALAQALSRALVSFLQTQGTRWSLNLAPDGRVLAFTAVLAALT